MSFLTRFLATGALILGCGATMAQDIKIGMNNVDDPAVSGEATFARAFAAALEGTDFSVTIYPSNTLGKEKERMDQVSTGLLEVNLSAISTAYSMTPLLKGVTLPFFFEDTDQLMAILDDPDLMAKFNEPLLLNGVRLVGINVIGVPMGLHNSKHPVATLDDIADLRFRALNPEQLDLIQALDSHGTVIAWAEVANAIQTGVADGYFNPPSSAIRAGHTSFLTHYTPADLFPSTRAVLVSDDWYQALDDAEKAQIDAAIDAGFEANLAWLATWSEDVTETQKEQGVTITELAPGEREKMIKAAESVWAKQLSPEDFKVWSDARDGLAE